MKNLAQIVQERAAELEGKWVALVQEYIPYKSGAEGCGDPLTRHEILCDCQCDTKFMGDEERPSSGGKIRYLLVVSTKPFVVQRWYEYSSVPTNIKVIKARHVRLGELRRFPHVPMPHFIRGAKGWSWVRLVDLANFLQQASWDLWYDYYAISRNVINDPGMEVCLDGCSKDRKIVRINGAGESFPYREAQYNSSRIWVPAGWVVKVCYLVHFRRLNDRRIARIV